MKDKTMYCGILPLLAFCGCENDKVDDYFGARPNILIAIADDMSIYTFEQSCRMLSGNVPFCRKGGKTWITFFYGSSCCTYSSAEVA